jgi:hypothetical protein
MESDHRSEKNVRGMHAIEEKFCKKRDIQIFI